MMNKRKDDTVPSYKAILESLAEEYDFSQSDLIGEGSFSFVYKAINRKLNRVIALKILKKKFPSDLQNNEEADKIFDEARIQASLNHDNIATIYKVDIKKGILFLEMEYIDGVSLYKHIKTKSRLSLQETLNIAYELLNVLELIHKNGIIYGDINSNNILIDKEGQIHLIDFGISTIIGSHHSDTSFLLGAREFISPEKLQGEAVDFRSDFYAFGVLLYECFTGKSPLPFHTGKSYFDTIIHEPPVPFSYHGLIGYDQLEKSLIKLMEKSPSKRPDSIKSIRSLLANIEINKGFSSRKKYLLITALALLIVIVITIGVIITDNQKNNLTPKYKTLQPNGLNALKQISHEPKNMVLVPGGTFVHNGKTETMASFYALDHEVTIAEFAKFVADENYVTNAETDQRSLTWVPGIGLQRGNGVNWQYNELGKLIDTSQYKSRPVVHVSWNDAQEYAKYMDCRLPTPTEWKYMASGYDFLKSPRKNLIRLSQVAWFNETALNKLHPIKQKERNSFGLYDLLGNAGEWCSMPAKNIKAKEACIAGGDIALSYNYFELDSAYFPMEKNYRDGLTGFRIIKDVD